MATNKKNVKQSKVNQKANEKKNVKASKSKSVSQPKSKSKSKAKVADVKSKVSNSKSKQVKNAKTDAKSKSKDKVKATKTAVVKTPAVQKDTKKPQQKKPQPKKSQPKTKKSVTPPKDQKKNGKRKQPASSDKADDKKEPVKKTKSSQNIVKVITKGGAAVDSLVPDKQNYRVLIDGGKTYSATLNQANLDHNNNKFYIIQALVNQKTGAFSVWNRWGRVGVPGQNVMKPMPNKDAAIRDYLSKHRDKTQSGSYMQIQIKYDDEKEEKQQPAADLKKSKGPKKQVKSKMDQGLQNLMNLIFDVQVMNNTMKQIGYDAKKMPLGRLGDSTIKQAYTVLSELSKAIKKGDRSQYSSLSGKFYTLIPHDFGFQKMSNFVLDNDEKIKQKIKMLEAISDMKITTKLLDQKNDDQQSVLDQNYKKLGCDIKTVDQKSQEYSLLKEYFDNTKGNGFKTVKVGQIYEVCRPNEQSSYDKKIGNNMLLWHGSRLSNFVGILSQGLRIAPPEAPVSGYLFGKGIYLADMAQKSIHYCRSYGSDTALILLIQGAIGNPNILLQSNHQAKQLMQANKKHSTKCHGSQAPPEQSYVNHKNMIIPKGKAVPTNSGSWMGHNQYIVYNMNQARIRYLIRMDMKGA